MLVLLLLSALAQDVPAVAPQQPQECAVFQLNAPSGSDRPTSRVPSSAPATNEAPMLPGTLRVLPAGWRAVSGGLLQPNFQGLAQLSPFFVVACR